ncbi:unnamed protein product [Caenorhabditis bovis]|uniref:Phosphofurin acidic cluster sorting protein 2 n=1 Tax=Caenorhabditis bovis TaxID=2654633 RepID=A0A8S1E778_9PELO|nr:unnamed protein product [Caenorhabditis bovis]
MENSNLLAMRLFATWDVDRATPSTVPRIFNVSINRIVLDGVPPQLTSINVTAKLPLSKRNRSLRSNEIKVTPCHGRIDLNCDISFTIQYPHFLKRKANILQIMIQRRRKYKNRLPGGFKDIAAGVINLSSVMQQGGLKEIPLCALDPDDTKGATITVGRMMFTSCYSQAPEQIEDRDKTQKVADDSEEDTETDYDDVPLDELADMPTSSRSLKNNNPERRQRQKNIKQKLSKLIRRFKLPPDNRAINRDPGDDDGDMFDDLSDFSDSGPEMMLNDDSSICSNPRPCLQPFFTRSREILPAIYDGQEVEASESEGDREEGWSSEADNMKENAHQIVRVGLSQNDSVGSSCADNAQTPRRNPNRTICASYTPACLPHSNTTHSIGKNEIHRGTSLPDQLSSILGANISSEGDVVWMCNISEFTSFAELCNSIPLVNCPTAQHVKQAMNHIVSRILSFCHSNSSNPPMTTIGVIGSDRIFARVLRAYVDSLAHKSSSNWLKYIQFLPIPSTSSMFYRHIEGCDPQLDNLCRDLWDRFNDMTPSEKLSMGQKLSAWSNNKNVARLNLPIGEAMLQLVADKDPDLGRIFLPFLCEVRVGKPQIDSTLIGTDDDSGGNVATQNAAISPRDEKDSSRGETSPPQSPHLRNADGQELSLDFLINNNLTSFSNSNGLEVPSGNNLSNTPTPKKDRITNKAHFKTLIVSRQVNNNLLTLTYLKEKRKDKMLQKLGMKKGQKVDCEVTPNQVLSVGRVLCSASGKHNDLTIFVDGTAYSGVRYFQASPQWQTHIKSFPIALLSTNPN